MFYGLSKSLLWLTEPLLWLLFVQLIALALLLRRRHRAATWALLAAIAFPVINELPVAGMLMRSLEQTFPSHVVLPGKVDGILVLGGAEEYVLSDAYGRPQLNSEAERLLEFVALAREHPHAKLVYSGGAGPAAVKSRPADIARKVLTSQGFDTARVIFEEQSRNTHESAMFSWKLMRPLEGETWVLITSASHMPRAHAAFRKAGWKPIAYPVSYHAMPAMTWREPGTPNYEMLRIALREWIGLGAYRLSGRI
jgi:uncharacterized SAM-binding protein YcdF (DUF218 family)